MKGKSTCKDCPKGRYCPKGSSTPQVCPAGKYVDATKSKSIDSCKVCEKGKYCLNGEMKDCPPDQTTTKDGSEKAKDCVCKKDYYDENVVSSAKATVFNTTTCRPCPEGATCAGLGEFPVAKDGFAVTSDATKFVRCQPSVACVKNTQGRNVSDLQRCNEGYQSVPGNQDSVCSGKFPSHEVLFNNSY